MNIADTLTAIAVILGLIHFLIPIIYYWYLKGRWIGRPWNIKLDPGYRPRVTVIIPTYNEVKFIVERLNNLYGQDYPKDLMEVIVVDSASTDGTPELVEKWAAEHTDFNIRFVKEKMRRGKTPAIIDFFRNRNNIFSGNVVMFTDADALWNSNAITSAVKYFADPSVGSLSGSISYHGETIENVYRNYYNVVRIAESKYYGTPIHNGPFIAIRGDILRSCGLPHFPGSDDSSWGSFVAFMGYRAIQVDDVIVKEPVRQSQLRRKVRRAQHLLLSFLKTKKFSKKLGLYRPAKPFEKIWRIEWWLHAVNPWLLVVSATLLVMGAFYGSLTAITLLGIGLALLMLKAYGTWVLQQLYLVIAAIRSLWTREVTWSK